MIQILFVCLGNICRSPLAEGIFNQLVKGQHLSSYLLSDSAGTSDYHIGQQPDRRTILIGQKHNMPIRHVARQFIANDFEKFDYIIAMDQKNYQHIMSMRKNHSDYITKISLMRDFESNPADSRDVPDPYWSGEDGFQQVYDILYNSISNFIDHLKKEHQLS